jgi:hypothetical protein
LTALAPTLQAWFTDHLIGQRDASPNTVAAYRDCLRLLLTYAHQRHKVTPARLDVEHLDDRTITGFLDMLEGDRNVSVATRNARLAAIHSLFTYASFQHPEHAELIARVLAIPATAPGAGPPAQPPPAASRSPTSTTTRSTHSSPPPTATPGPDNATTRGCSS